MSYFMGALLCAGLSLPMSAAEQFSVVLNPNDVTSQPIAPNFASFSMEWSRVKDTTSAESFPNLLQNLKQSGPEAPGPNLRIGGNSADLTWWDPTGTRNKSESCKASYSGDTCIKNGLTADDIRAAQAAAKALNGSLTLDLVMLQNASASWAAEEAQAFKETINWSFVESVEIGNEQDLFSENGFRSPSYSPDDYARELDMYREALAPLLPSEKFVQGGTFCCKSQFEDAQAAIAQNRTSWLKTWSFHRYPTSTCNGRNSSIGDLMSNLASDGQAKRVKDTAEQINGMGVPFVIGEGNSASCGGQKGLSDTMTSALWSIDFLFALASVNVSRMNFHGGGSGPYTWFGEPSGPGGCGPDVRPLFYGMYAFARATANNSRLIAQSGGTEPLKLPCSDGIISENVCCASSCGTCGGSGCDKRPGGSSECCSGTIKSAGRVCQNASDTACILSGQDSGPLVKTWAVRDDNGGLRLIVVHKNYTEGAEPADISVSLAPGEARNAQFSASLEVLRAEGTRSPFTATRGLTVAGQTFDGSKCGELVGSRSATPIEQKDDVWNFSVSPGSAATLRLDPM